MANKKPKPKQQSGATPVVTPAPSPNQAQAQDQKASWKDNPIIVAAGASAATLSATIAVFLQVVLPTREVDMKNKVAAQEAAQAQLQASLSTRGSEVRELQAKLAVSENRAAALHSELAVALTSPLFNSNDPYPNGFRAVRVGDSIEAVRKAYPHAAIDKSLDGVLVVKDYHPVFSRVSYFFDADEPKKLITHIVFEVKDAQAYPDDFLQRKLRDALGSPRLGAKPAHVAWIRDTGPSVFKSENRSYLLAAEGVSPNWWKPRP